MRKEYKITIITIVIIGFIVLFFALLYPKGVNVESFSVEDYSEIIAESSRNVEDSEYGEINNAQEAICVAKQFWKKHYNYLSCSVFYDSTNRVWLVKGNKFLIIPSGPYILISEKDGKVLAFWDYKF